MKHGAPRRRFRIRGYALLAAAWTVAVAASLAWNLHQRALSVVEVARSEARSAFAKDVAYRQWAASHGGVYVPRTERTPPNPYLAHVAERDIRTPSGRELTLVNPAYMTRQVHEISRARYGLRGHITSRKPLRPANAPDEWERRALERLEMGEGEVSTLAPLDGAEHLRLMMPLYVEPGCLKCHAAQGYRLGDLCGGISVSVGMGPLRELARADAVPVMTGHAGIWLLGLAGIVFAGRQADRGLEEQRRSEARLAESERRYRSLAEASAVGIWHITPEGRTVYVNPAMLAMLEIDGQSDIGDRTYHHFFTEESQRTIAGEAARRREGLASVYEAELIGARGTRRWVTVCGAPLLDPGGALSGLIGTFTDITPRRLAEAERDRLFRLSQDAVVIYGLDLTLRQANPAFLRLTGLREEEALGRPAAGFAHPEDWTTAEAAWREAGRGRPVEGVELRGPVAGGSFRWFSWSLAPALEQGLIYAVGRDVTECRLAAEEMRRAKEAAEEASRIKGEFLANVSHEIRTPLNGVIGMTGLLMETELGAEQRDFAAIAHRSAETLLALVNEVLDFSKMEAGKTQLEAMDFDPRHTVSEVIGLLSFLAREKGLELSAEVDPRTPLRLRGDAARLRHILLNLAGNAVKFTEQGRVRIGVVAEGDSGGDATLRFEVTDTGIGIPPDRLPCLFQPFTQADATTTRRFGGTGLGLAISKRLVELMGGEIAVESEEGRGSRFWFRLRFLAGNRASPAGGDAAGHRPRHLKMQDRRPRVLVVEDNSINQRVLVGLLEKLDCQADAVTDGRECLRRLEAVRYDVVLMDCHMPGMDGYEATRAIRDPASPVLQHDVPVIAVTASAMSGDRERCLAAGMNDYLAKPIALPMLAEKIGAWLAAAESRPTSPPAAATTPSLEDR